MYCEIESNSFRRKELEMATRICNRLFIHDGGEIACSDHFGAYATAQLQRTPNARLLQTPLGTWERLSDADVDQLAEMGVTAHCETCAARARNRGRSQR